MLNPSLRKYVSLAAIFGHTINFEMIIKYSLVFIFSFLIYQISLSQTLDRNLYLSLLNADSAEFINYAKNMNFEITNTSNIIFARSKDFRFEKPIIIKPNISWNTVLVVSSKNKENNQVIYQNAKRSKNHKNSLLDKKYLYIETEMKNQATNEIWYTVEILRRLI